MAKANSSTFMLEDVDVEKVKSLIDRNDQSVDYFNNVVEDIVNKHCSHIDTLMNEIKHAISNRCNPIVDEDLDYYILNLPNSLFFCGEAVEALGVKKDMAKAERIDSYTKVQMLTAGTVADKDAKASSETKFEQILESMYDRACKKVKQRIDAGYEMLSALKLILRRRMMAYDLTGVSSGRIAPSNGYSNNNFNKENNY